MNAKQIWQTTIERLQQRINPYTFTTWFQGTSAQSFQDGIFTILVPSTFAKSHLEGRFIDVIRSILADVTGEPVEVQIIVLKEKAGQAGAEEVSLIPPRRGQRLGRSRLPARARRLADAAAEKLNTLSPLAPRRPESSKSTRVPPMPRLSEEPEVEQHHTLFSAIATPISIPALNPRYTFTTFIVGKTNQLAHAASLAASENPGKIYNPLFLYGGVGLGKTHLLHAVGHIGEINGLNVLYTTSEKFTNEIVNAIRFQKTEEFRAKYRQIDILLVDDIQFIAGKEATEDEFFHTFNSLHNANKQIVVTSDRPPKAISSLQDRLRSRFEWGLLADVQPPEYEHRLAILRSKCDSLRFAVPSNVVEFIARPACSSVRELEGALNRVIAYATLHDAPLTVALAAQALEHIFSSKKPSSNLSVAQVLDGVCRYFNVDPDLLRGRQRDRDIVWPRQVAMYLMREETNASLLQVGHALGGRDHTTIMHGWEKVHTEMSTNERVRQEIAAVLEAIQHNDA